VPIVIAQRGMQWSSGDGVRLDILAFGHPAPSTIETLERSSARVDRTDRCGAAVITIGKEISTMLRCELPAK
jgi:hypothetical protein